MRSASSPVHATVDSMNNTARPYAMADLVMLCSLTPIPESDYSERLGIIGSSWCLCMGFDHTHDRTSTSWNKFVESMPYTTLRRNSGKLAATSTPLVL